MPCLITNRSSSPLTLPSPLQGILAPGQKIVVELTKEELIGSFGSIVPPTQMSLETVAQSSNFNSEYEEPTPVPPVTTDVQIFEEDGTWIKPEGNFKWCDWSGIGTGGSGASGRMGEADTPCFGGGAGGTGARKSGGAPFDSMPATVPVIVPDPPAGGAAVSTNDTDGNNGASPSEPFVSFGDFMRVSCGNPGMKGTDSSAPGGAGGFFGDFPGTAGGRGGGDDPEFGLNGETGTWPPHGPGPGGGGGGLYNIPGFGGVGGSGGESADPGTVGGTPGDGMGDPNGGDGTDNVAAGATTGGSGGGGGGALDGQPGGNGGKGGRYGAGGGGGAAARNDNGPSGAGGIGGKGLLVVVCT